MKEISEAAARVEKDNKRKEQAGGWGSSVNKSAKPGGWGSNPYPAQASEPAQTGGWGQGSAPAQTWNGGQGQGKGGKGKGKAPHPPAGGPPPASFGGNAASTGTERGRPGYNQCAYCFKEGHYKDTCPELLAVNARNAQWANSGW